MKSKWLKGIVVGGALLAVTVVVGVYGVSIVQASTGPIAIGSIEGPKFLAHPGSGEGAIDKPALLAEALGISVEELQEAHQAANEAALEQLVDEGILTEEQAENAKAASALRDYLDHTSLTAEALGMSSAEWEAAKEDGKSLSEILEEQGMDAASYRENLAAAIEAAIQQAVVEGVITQEQADNFDSRHMFGFGHRGWGELLEGFEPGECRGPGRGGFRHPFGPQDPPQEDASNTTNA